MAGKMAGKMMKNDENYDDLEAYPNVLINVLIKWFDNMF